MGGEVCDSCGEPYATVWNASDELWLAVAGGPGGLRCIRCFDAEALAAGLHPYWQVADGEFPTAYWNAKYNFLQIEAEQAEQRVRTLEERIAALDSEVTVKDEHLEAAESRLAQVEGALGYIATMLEGDTDRNQVAQYVRNDVLSTDKEDA